MFGIRPGQATPVTPAVTAPASLNMSSTSSAANPTWTWLLEGAGCAGADVSRAPGGANSSSVQLTTGPTNSSVFNLRGATGTVLCGVRPAVTDAFGTYSAAGLLTIMTVGTWAPGGVGV